MTCAEALNLVSQSHHGCHNRLDTSYRQGRIEHHYEKSVSAWHSLAMLGTSAMDTFKAALQRVMDEKGVKRTPLSQRVGNSKTLITEILEKNADIKLSTIERIAEELAVPVRDLLADDKPIGPPTADELERMIERAQREMSFGTSVEGYPRAVAASLHDQLAQYLASGGYRDTEGGESGPGRGARPPAPTKAGEPEAPRNP